MLILRDHRWQKFEKQKRLNFFTCEINNKILKSLLFNKLYTRMYQLYFYKLFQKLTKKQAISYTKRTCLWTGYSRSVFQKFKLSRHFSKKWAAKGYLPGLRKSSF